MFSNEIPLLSLSAENLGYIFWLGRILYLRGYLFWVRRRYRNSLGEALRFRIAIITQSSVDCGGWEFGAARKGLSWPCFFAPTWLLSAVSVEAQEFVYWLQLSMQDERRPGR
jgi:hypothetical protein